MVEHLSLEQQLALIAQQVQTAQQSLLDGGADHFLTACHQIQGLAVELTQTADIAPVSSWTPDQFRRFSGLASQLSALRDSLARRRSFVDRALQIVVPTDDHATYPHASAYGKAIRQSGAFKVLAA